MKLSTSRGLITITSPHDTKTTADRLEDTLKTKGMNIFERINHSQAAAGVGMELRPTELLLFGNPQSGTPLMQSSQTAAIDFPQKALVWQDEQGQVRISFNDPDYLMKRHDLEDMAEVAGKMKSLLEGVSATVCTT